jgi:hypothetical protein
MKLLITLILMGCIIYAGSCLTASDYRSICNSEKAVWNDDFTTFNSRWDWNYNKGTGYKLLTTIDNVSVVEIGITDQSTSSSYSDCSLHEKSYQYNYGVFEARLRYTGDNGFGTMGWGFWNYENHEKAECAWFWAASPESGALLSDFQAVVAIDSAIEYQKFLPEIDIEKWHIYRVEFSSDGVRFFVDGLEVASTSQCLSKQQRFELWIDNYRVQVVDDKAVPVGYLNIQQDQRMYIDWVRYNGERTNSIFDTHQSEKPYPSISGRHTGTITPSHDISVQKLYTYPCAGTGGHTKSVRIYGNEIDKSASWTGYDEGGDTLTFDLPFTLEAGKTYSYEIITGSYPQIHHTVVLQTDNGVINCSKFADANGKVYDDWIPAIRLFS